MHQIELVLVIIAERSQFNAIIKHANGTIIKAGSQGKFHLW